VSMAATSTDILDAATLKAMLGPELTAEQAALIFQQGQEAVVFALLTLAKQLTEKGPPRGHAMRHRPDLPPSFSARPSAGPRFFLVKSESLGSTCTILESWSSPFAGTVHALLNSSHTCNLRFSRDSPGDETPLSDRACGSGPLADHHGR
jgi:hypothetical protein